MGSGFRVTGNSHVINCYALNNGSVDGFAPDKAGIVVTGDGSRIEGNSCFGNNGSGIYLFGANTIRNLVVHNSVPGQGTGIDATQSVRDLNQIAPEHGPAELDTLTNPYLNFGK